jgi:hypothetical protein
MAQPGLYYLAKCLKERNDPPDWVELCKVAAKEIESLEAGFAEAKAIVDKLPKTADGVVVTPDMKILWAINNGEVSSRRRSKVADDSWVYGRYESESARIRDCYSTREAAEAAKAREK